MSLTKEATDLIHEEHMVPLCPELGDACRRWQGGDQHSPRELESSEDVRQETVKTAQTLASSPNVARTYLSKSKAS